MILASLTHARRWDGLTPPRRLSSVEVSLKTCARGYSNKQACTYTHMSALGIFLVRPVSLDHRSPGIPHFTPPNLVSPALPRGDGSPKDHEQE